MKLQGKEENEINWSIITPTSSLIIDYNLIKKYKIDPINTCVVIATILKNNPVNLGEKKEGKER